MMLFKFEQQIRGHSAKSDVGSRLRNKDRRRLMLSTNRAEAVIVSW